MKGVITGIVLTVVLMLAVAEQTNAQSVYFTGDGGKGKSITILPPRSSGLTENQKYLPDLVANELVSNFDTFSAMTLFDRVNLQKQYDELLSGYYSDNDAAGNDLGHLASTDYMLLGSITKTSTSFALQLTVSRNSDKTTVASYSGPITIVELDNLTGVRRASLELLQKMQVQLTAQAQMELTKAAAVDHVSAQTAMAQGISAQRQGTVVEALSYFIQASNYDTSLAEAAGRLNILTANVTSGNIGENVRNDLVWRDQWVARLKECEEFYANYVKNPPPYNLVYSTNIEQGEVNYEKRTVSVSFEIGAFPDEVWFKTLDTVVKTVKQGLDATKRASVWKLDKWPVESISEINPFKNYIGGFSAAVEILNSDGKKIAERESIGFPTGLFCHTKEDRYVETFAKINYAMPLSASTAIIFPAADPMLIDDKLNIKIVSIDGAAPEKAAQQKNISILPASQYTGSRSSLMKKEDRTGTVKKIIPNTTFWWVRKSPVDYKTAIIHHGVTSIENNAYQEQYLDSVVIPNSVTSIGDLAFINLRSDNRLANVVIPGSVKSIGRAAFQSNQLTSIVIPNGVVTIGDNAFRNNKLTSVVIPNSVTSIGREAFSCWDTFTSITIGPNVKVDSIGWENCYQKNGRRAGVYTTTDQWKTFTFK